MEAFLTTLYGLVGGISIAAYVPQIWGLMKATGRSEAFSISTWALWSFTGTVTAFYAAIVVKDLPFIVVSILNMLGIITVLFLIIYNRYFRFGDTLPAGMSLEVAEEFQEVSEHLAEVTEVTEHLAEVVEQLTEEIQEVQEQKAPEEEQEKK